ELGGSSGIVRAHGSRGAFVSRWVIDRKTLKVLEGADFTQSANDVYTWDPATGAYLQGTTVWQRFCSGDLAKRGAYFHDGLGTRDRIYLNGEEVTEGRAWARIATGPNAGEAWQLPRLGRMSYENAVASPYPQEKTIVVLLDDSALSTAPTGFPSEVYVYIGTKTQNGHPIVQAGLTNGDLYGLKIFVDGSLVTEESNEFGLGDAMTGFIGKGRFSLENLGDVSNLSARELEDLSIGADIARLQRVEDGAWDPRRKYKNDFYFVTTASLTSNCRLWRLRFDDITNPEQGGEIEILLAGDEGHRMLDNVTIDRLGRILMDEDPGNTDRVAKIWLYDIASGGFETIAEHNPKFFDPTIPNSNFITQDEESSGIIDARRMLGEGWFLFDVQVHKLSDDPELVEGGQLLSLYVDPNIGGESEDEDDNDEDAEA
ncbi:MAG TPA: phytase, partial [Candidatus Binatia bacterium]|nr:phytase [Candidatus Binatia bacterium]